MPGDGEEVRNESTEPSSSRTIGGCGERAFFSLRVDMDEGEREGGKEEKEACRWRAGSVGPLPFIFWVKTSAMRVSIFHSDHFGVVGFAERGAAGSCAGRCSETEPRPGPDSGSWDPSSERVEI